MLVRYLMTTPVVTIRPDATIKQAVELLAKHSITALPVVDAAGRIVGVISEADVIEDAVMPDQRAHERPVQLKAGPFVSRVSEVMSRQVLSVPPEADVAEAAELMSSTVVKSLPVVDRGRVVGILSRHDIIESMARRDDLIEAQVDELLRASGDDWLVDVTDGVVMLEGPMTPDDQDFASVVVGTVPGVRGVYFKAARST